MASLEDKDKRSSGGRTEDHREEMKPNTNDRRGDTHTQRKTTDERMREKEGRERERERKSPCFW